MPRISDILHVDRVVDVSDNARAEGFLVPVGISRVTYYSTFHVWSPCACPLCEESAKNATKDRIQRALRLLADTILAVHPDDENGPDEISFVLDVPAPKSKGKTRRAVPLRANLGPRNATHPVVTITEERELHLHPLTDFRRQREEEVL